MIADFETALSPENYEAVLAFLPLLDRSGVRTDPPPAFMATLYDHNWVVDYDWGAWQKEARELYDNPKRIAAADVETLRKLITTICRVDRFVENSFAIACTDGVFTQILKRIQRIYVSL